VTNKQFIYKKTGILPETNETKRSSMVYANACFTPNNYKNYENITETSKPVRTKKETSLLISVLV